MTLGFVFRKRHCQGSTVAQARPVQHFGKLDGVFDGKLGARSNGKMRGMCSIAKQDDIVERPSLARHASEVDPRSRAAQVRGVGNEGVAIQMPCENTFAGGHRILLFHRAEPQALPGFWGTLDNERRMGFVEAVGMCPDPPGFRLLENEGEGIEQLGGTEPAEAIAAHLYVDIEAVFMKGANLAVHAICGHDQIEFGVSGKVGIDFGFKVQHHAQLAGPLLQDLKQALATDADKPVPGRDDGLLAYGDFDIVPVRKTVRYSLGTDRIVARKIIQGLIGEDHAPTKGVASVIALEHMHIVAGVAQLHRQGEIGSCRTAA